MEGRLTLESLLAPLAAFVIAHDGDALALTFAQIEDIIGAPLPMRQRTHMDAWEPERHGSMRRLHEAGWRARLDYPNRRVVFWRTGRG